MNKHFHTQLKFERTQRGWTQRELGRRAGMSRSLISLIEHAQRIPTNRQRSSLVRALGMPRDNLGRIRERQPLGGWPEWQRSKLWEKFRGRPERYRVDRDRENWTRFRAARKQYRRIYDYLLARAIQMVGRTVLDDLVHYGCCESGLEAIVWLQLIVAGVLISYVSPARLGWCRMPVVEHPSQNVVNDRLWPAFVVDGPLLFALLPQVRLKPWDSCAYRVDLLACVRVEDRLVWVDVEVDGPLHKTKYDRDRTAALRLPRVKLTEEDALSPDFLERLQTKLLAAVA